MIITYYGLTCFKVQSGDTVLAIDPFSKATGLTPPRFVADVVLSTGVEAGPANGETLGGSPLLVRGPGEYETKGITIDGIAAGGTTLYLIEWEGIRLCHLGALTEKDFSAEVAEAVDSPDILFVPVGGGSALDTDDASTVVNKIEPRIIIPMYYKMPNLKTPVLSDPEKFIEEFGAGTKPEDKFTFKLKDLPQEETKLIVLAAQGGKQ